MVDIVRPGGTGGVAPASPDQRRDSGTPFVVDPSLGRPVQPARLTAATGIGFETFLALQSVDENEQRNRAARKRGTAMIAALSDLQRAVLAAEDPALALRSLGTLAQEQPEAADPALASVLRAIVLRARVEVARREMSR